MLKVNCRNDECENYDEGICQDENTLCCNNPTEVYNYYCQSAPDLNYCTSSNHTTCQKVGSYYCTFDENNNNEWSWEDCTYGCNSTTQKCIPPTPEFCINDPIIEVET